MDLISMLVSKRLFPAKPPANAARPLSLRARFSLALLAPVMALAGCTLPSEPGSHESEVIGGRSERGFSAAGYLAKGPTASSLSGPSCGATLIAPDIAVTAAHCIENQRSGAFGFGVGSKDQGIIVPAVAVLNHPLYKTVDSPGQPRFWHDLALMKLARPVPGVSVASVVDVAPGQGLTYVGYGRVTEGGYDRFDGYTGERKSADFQVSKVDEHSLFVTGRDGGNCWGDSGGPLLDPRTGGISGVLADFDGLFECRVGNQMIFTRLTGERAFLDAARACVVAQGFIGDLPASCAMGGSLPPTGALEEFATGEPVADGTVTPGWRVWHDSDLGWGKNWRVTVKDGAQEIGVRPGSFGIERDFGARVQGKLLRITHSFSCAKNPCWYEVLSEKRTVAKWEASFGERTDELRFDPDEKVVRFKVGSSSADGETHARILRLATP